MGNQGLERALIGTLASCPRCKPSDGWLGRYSLSDKSKRAACG
jgi:hypothetical protein